MESFVFNSFKERMINGELSGNDVWTLQPVKKAFAEDYEDNLKYIRNETDLYYLNPGFNELGYLGVSNSFKDKYFTVMNPVHYNYTIMQNTDIAKQPEYITKDNIIDFFAKNPDESDRNINLKNLFFDEDGKFYRPSDEKELNSDGEEVPIPLGFYYVRTKEELRWCANLVNSEAYNNKINIVLGDNIGVEKTQTTLNFIIGENPNRPFEGIFYGNGYKFNNIELICDKPVNGIVGYLGTNGIISTIRVNGRIVLNCKSKITLEHLMSVGSDVAAGFICGKNNGVIEGINFDAVLVLYNFIPGICSVGNKSDSTLPAIEDNPMVNFCYPDYLCYNSLGNIVPYIGYFNEGVFATYDGIDRHHTSEYHCYWKTLNFSSTIQDGYMIKRYNLDGNDYQSPQEWYYFAGIPYENRLIDYYTKEENVRNVLFYDSTIFGKINSEYFDGISLQTSKAGILPINFADIYMPRWNAYSAEGTEFFDYHKERKFSKAYDCMPYVNYFDKSIKMQQQNRVAYYVSPIIGINNREVKDIYVNCSAEASATFVGFLGGLAGKQNYGYITGCNVNLSSYDSLCTDSTKPNYYKKQLDDYGVFHERTIFNTEYTNSNGVEETYSFPLQSIKNIGGMFGSCIVSDTNSLIVKNCNIMFENRNAAVISSTDVSGINPLSEDYYLLDRYAGIAAMMEFNTCNLSDIWATSADLADESTRCIKFENTLVTYREATGTYVAPVGYEFVQQFNVNDDKRFHSIINNIQPNGTVILDDQPIYGIAAPLVGELKPIYIGSPSMLESLFPGDCENYDKCDMGGLIPDGITTPPPYQYYSLSYGNNMLKNYFDGNKRKLLNNMVGLFYMDQNLAAPAAVPAFYGDSLDVAIPGVKNISSGTNYNIMDHLMHPNNDYLYKAMSYRVDDVLSHIVDWRQLSATNNHNVWNRGRDGNNILKYSVVPSAAELQKRLGDNQGNDSVEPNDGYGYINANSFNKVNYLYPYFGSDFVLIDEYVSKTNHNNKISKGYAKYSIEIPNPFYDETYEGDGDVTPRNRDKKFIIEVNLQASSTATLDEKYKIYAVTENGDTVKMDYSPEWKQKITRGYDSGLRYVDGEIRTYGQEGRDSISIEKCWTHLADDQEADVGGGYNPRIYVHNIIGCNFDVNDIKNNFFTLTCIVHRYRNSSDKGKTYHLYAAKNIRLSLDNAIITAVPYVSEDNYHYITKLNNDITNNIVNDIQTTLIPPLIYDASRVGTVQDDAAYGIYSAYWLQPDYSAVNENGTVVYYPISGYDNNDPAIPLLAGLDDWSAAKITYVHKEHGPGIKISEDLTLYNKVDWWVINEMEPDWNQAAIVSAYKFKVDEYSGSDLLTQDKQVYKIIPADATSYDETYTYTTAFALGHGQPNYIYHTWGGLNAHMSANFNDVFVYREDGKFPYPISVSGTDDSTNPKPWYQSDTVYSGRYKLAVKTSHNNNTNKPASAEAYYGSYNADNISAYYNDLTANIKISDYGQHKNDTLVDYFKYTYEKTPANAHINICSAGFKLPVIFDYKNNKAGFWFNMNESAAETTRDLKDVGVVPVDTCSAYNDNMYYTSNVFAIGKTPNQSCIINEHLADPEITAVSFSSFSADDFEGIYVTDGENRPVMYIDVGLGECPEGTTWTYSAYPSYSANIETSLDTSVYDKIADTDEEKAEKLRMIERRNTDVKNAMNASGLILEVET